MLFKVRSTLSFLAIFISVTASPASIRTRTDVNVPFTFSQWVEGIIADPNGARLTAEEAIEASYMARRLDLYVKRQGPARAQCMDEIPGNGWPAVDAMDAVPCVEMLARKGAAGVMCDVPSPKDVSVYVPYCENRSAQILGFNQGEGFQTSSCADVARAAGWIFDKCWKEENRTVKGEADNMGNDKIHVIIRGFR